MKRWMLSQCATEENGTVFPVARAYGYWNVCPDHPTTTDGWCLILLESSLAQIEAAKLDSRVVVCPLVFAPSLIPAQVLTAYADKGAMADMTMGALIAHLAEIEPLYAQQ